MTAERDALTRENAALTRLCADRDHYAEEVQTLTREVTALREAQAEIVKHAVAVCAVWENDDDETSDDVWFEIIDALRAALPAPPPAREQEGQ